jgi:hypothetical protein
VICMEADMTLEMFQSGTVTEESNIVEAVQP